METKENVYEAIKNDKRFTILSKILESTGIGEAMSNEREAFTFFAPTDDAFRRLSKKALTLLVSPEGTGLVAAILGQHLIPKNCLYSNDLRRRDSVKTLRGNNLEIKNDDGALKLEGARVLVPEIVASNAVVFPVDKVFPVKRKIISARIWKETAQKEKPICRK